MTGMTCTRCRTEDPSRSSPASLRPSIRSCLSSTVDLLDVRRLGRARSGYLLRGRCGLNLINSMRHLDKCAPRTRIQRIIFILIHLPFSLSLPYLWLVSLLSTDPSLGSLASLRPPSPLTGPRSGRSNRFFGYQIPDSYSSSASTLRRGEGGWEVRRKKDAFIRSHLAGIICLFDVAPYLIR